MATRIALSVAAVALIAQTAMSQESIAAVCSYQDIACDSHVSGRLENSGCLFTDGKPYVLYRIATKPGMAIDAFLQASTFHPYLGLYHANDSEPTTYDTGLSIARVSYEFLTTDTYWLVAAAADGAPSGAFFLDYYCSFTCVQPAVTSQFQSMTVAYGDVTSLSVTVDGTPPFSFRWFDAAAPNVTLGTQQTFTSPPVTKDTAFHVQISNGCGQDDFYAALVKVSACTKPTISAQPQSAVIHAGEQVVLQVGASGVPAPAYHWFQDVPNSVTPVGGDSPFLILQSVTVPRHVWVQVANSCGTAESDHVSISVVLPAKRRAVKH